MRKLVLMGVIVALCIGFTAGAAFAQDTTIPVFCGDLEQADCDLLRNSQATMEALDSVAFGFSVTTTVTNVPDMTEPVVVTLMGDGAVTGLTSVRDSAAMMETDPGAHLTNMLSNFDARLALTLNLPPELMEEVDSSIPGNMSLEAMLVDGVGYVNTDSLQPFLNNPSIEGWYGLDLAGLFQGLLEQNPDLFANMGDMQMFSMDMESMALAQQFSDPAFLSRFATIEVVDIGMPDETIFRTTINFGALMSSPEFQDLMRQQMQMQGQTMTDEEMGQAMAMSSQMLKNLTFVIDQTIGTNDFYLRAIHGTMNMDTVAMMAMMESESGSSGDSKEPAPVINVDFTLFYNSFDMVPEITAPLDATIIPWQMLLNFGEPVPPPTFPTATTAAPQPTEEPTSEVTAEPTSEVTAEPTGEVTAEPTGEVTVEPTAEATAQS